jgi:LmbE family N-acetylglucosaminyl deacetylase
MASDVICYLSPHLDDAVLSCGGLIYRQAAAGANVVIVTFFTADLPPHAPVSPLAERNHRMWRLPSAPFSARCEEDEAAMSALCAKALHLGLLDAMYRTDSNGRPLYTQKTVGIPVHPYDTAVLGPHLFLHIQHVIRQLAPDQIFCPLGIGGHVDHQLVKSAFLEYLHSTGSAIIPGETECYFYEDYPYALYPEKIRQETSPFPKYNQLEAVTTSLTEKEFDHLISSAFCYTSQIPALFPSETERWLEIFSTYLPLFRPWLRSNVNTPSARRRMTNKLRYYVGNVGGIRYWKIPHPERKMPVSMTEKPIFNDQRINGTSH